MSRVSTNYKYEYKMVSKSYKLKEYDSLNFFLFFEIYFFVKTTHFYAINIEKK